MKKKLLYLLLILSIVFVSISYNRDKSDNGNLIKYENEEKNSNLKDIRKSEEKEKKKEKNKSMEEIKGMTLKEKIGQLMIVGFEGTSLNEAIEKYIIDYKVGGLIFFSRNIESGEESFKLVNDMKTINKQNDIPLFISIDEEGGRVSRLPKEFKKLPTAKTLGNIDEMKISFEYGKIIASRLNSLGFNLDFAPVLDINSNPKNPVIGDRAFGDNEKTVSRNAIDTMKGIGSEGIISAVKHFPGHGDTSVDSHKALPIVFKTLEELKKMELIPFKKAVEKNVDSIMVAHILYKAIDEDYPATMSKEIINELLRKEMAFKGVVISDDMTMGAILENYSLERASLKFLQAGGDVLLICHGKDNPELVIKAIEKAVEENVLSEDEIDEKVYRILQLKKQYNIDDEPLKEYNIEKNNKLTDDFLEKINGL